MARWLRIPRSAAAVSLALLGVGALALAAWLYGPLLAAQIATVFESLPDEARRIWSRLPRTPLGAAVTDGAESIDWQATAPLAFGSVAGIFSTAFGAVGGALIVLTLAVFLAAQPELYQRGFLLLVPAQRRERVAQVLDAVATALRWWLVGRAVAMAVVAVLTTVGLIVIGIDQAVALGVIAGLLTFVPYVGPIAALIPALLAALPEGAATAAWVLALYCAVQGFENYVVTPLAQSRAVSLAPALVIGAGVLLAVLFGALGVLLATPLTVVVVVAVQCFYVQDALGEEVQVLGQEARSRRPRGSERRRSPASGSA